MAQAVSVQCGGVRYCIALHLTPPTVEALHLCCVSVLPPVCLGDPPCAAVCRCFGLCVSVSVSRSLCKQLGAQVEELRENVQEALDTLDSIKDPPGNATDERENRDDSADAQQRGKLEDGASGGGKARRGRGAAEGDGVADAEDPGKGVNSGGGTGVGGQRLEVGGSGSGKGTPGTCISCEAVWW